MGRQIIKQPNGKYALFSSVTDSLNTVNATKERIIEGEIARAIVDTRERLEQEFKDVEKGNAYYQFTITWSDAVAMTKQNKDTPKKFLEAIDEINQSK